MYLISTRLCSSGGTHAAARNEARDSAAQEVSTGVVDHGPTSDGLAAFELACRTCDIDAAE